MIPAEIFLKGERYSQREYAINMKPKYIIIAAANGLSLLFALIITLIASGIAGSQPDQRVREKWAPKSSMPYAQVSAYTADTAAVTIDSIFMTRVNIDKSLVENSITSERENARLWTDAFSTSQRLINVSADKTSSEASMIATGGDFFLFHQLDMLYGSCYSDSDVMHDRVVIDETLAWRLYGSSNIAGKPVTINGKYFYIAGVFRQSGNSDMKKVYGEKPRIFMSYQGLELIDEGVPLFTCYEACLPSPVTGVGQKIFTEALKLDEYSSRIVENSARYGLKNRFTIISEFGMRSVADNSVYYPFWENAARITEDKSALVLTFQLAGLILPIVTVVWLFARFIKNRKKLTDKLKDNFVKMSDNVKIKMEKAKAKKTEKVSAGISAPKAKSHKN